MRRVRTGLRAVSCARWRIWLLWDAENRCFPMTCWGGVPSDVQKQEYSAGVRTVWALWSRPWTYRARKKVRNWTNRPNLWRKRRSRTARKPSRARMEAEYSKKCTLGRLPPWQGAGFATIARAVGCCAGSMRRFRLARCMRLLAVTAAASRQCFRCWPRRSSCSVGIWNAGRPRRRCCRRTPRHCWLPKRCATS